MTEENKRYVLASRTADDVMTRILDMDGSRQPREARRAFSPIS